MRKSANQKLLTDASITAIKKPAAGRTRVMDTRVPNFGVSVTDKGTKSYFLVARFPGSGFEGPSRREIGKVGAITLADARARAQKWNDLIGKGKDPAREAKKERKVQIDRDSTTVDAVLDKFVKSHASKLRSADQVKYAFDTYVRPQLGDMSIYDVRRSDIADMLDHVEREASKARDNADGMAMADRVLAQLRKAFNWQMARDDEFRSPIVRGMARTKPKEHARARTLEDDEIRDVWKALDEWKGKPCYPRFVKSLLLCATRRNESAFMHASEIEGDKWTIPADRYKNKLDHVVPLSMQARALIGDKPSGFIFSTTDGKKGFSGFSKAKRELDKEIARIRKAAGRKKMERWTLHDLRRTARTLMSRAKVSDDHAERCLGHVIPGVRGTYDRHAYLDEKRDAFERLAGLVDMILKPPAGNVVALR